MILCEKFSNQIKEGVAQIADNMKILLYKEAPHIFEQIDFENDKAFLEPLLFAYFNRTDERFPIESILQGYFKDKSVKYTYAIPNKEGIAYIPQIGYFNQIIKNSVNIDSVDESLLLLSNGIELLSYQHPLLEDKFRLNRINQFELANKKAENYESILEVEINKTTKYHYHHVQTAFDIIAEHLPKLHEEILISNRRIVLFHNPCVLCFASIQVHGTSFYTTLPSNDEIFFIEEIIHQCSHNTFNSLLFNKETFFKIDVEKTILGDLIGRPNEKRPIWSVFHGLYTVAKRFEAFYILYKKNIFIGKQKHEFIGRFADLRKRFKLGLELLDHSSIFTEKGLEVYYPLEQVCIEIMNQTKELDGLFDFSNQPSEFSYERFCMLNSLSHFEKIELV